MPSIQRGTKIPGPNGENFSINDFLGRGAFGEVYSAVGDSSSSVVAVKLLPINDLPDTQNQTALLNEVHAALQIQHPNVIRVLHVDAGTLPEVGPFVCMEFIPGGTLARILKSNADAGQPIHPTRALEMMIDIAQGAQAINTKIIHRDIKPDNILVDEKTLKIGDFGISKFISESTRTHTFKGGQHVRYMAPEAWLGETNTHKLDVYSVGIVFYEILTSRHPLAARVKDPMNWREWERAHLYEQPADVRALRQDISPALAQLLGRMLSKRPAERPEWNEVLSLLTNPATEQSVAPISVVSASIASAVEAAVGHKRSSEERELQAQREAHEHERKLQLYRVACTELLDKYQGVIDQFNAQYQFGKIRTGTVAGIGTVYALPNGGSVELNFFRPATTPITVRGCELLGGGWAGISRGRSANVVLLKASPDDYYGRWCVCEVKVMAVVDPRALIGQFGITEDTVQPFGFKDAYFDDQIRFATGIVHAFTYHFNDDPVAYFADLLAEACKG